MSFVTRLPPVPCRKIFYSVRHPFRIHFQLVVCGYSHWDTVNLFLAFAIQSQTSVLRLHANTRTVLLEYLHSQCWAHLHKTESCILEPNWDIFKPSFSKTLKSQWMGPDWNLVPHISYSPFWKENILLSDWHPAHTSVVILIPSTT